MWQVADRGGAPSRPQTALRVLQVADRGVTLSRPQTTPPVCTGLPIVGATGKGASQPVGTGLPAVTVRTASSGWWLVFTKLSGVADVPAP